MSAALLLASPQARAQAHDDVVVTADRSDDEAPRLAPGVRMSLHVEPGVAMALTKPQSDLFDTGGGQSIRLLFGLGRYLALGPNATFTSLPAEAAAAEAGTSWSAGVGLRVMRPHDEPGGRLRAMSPWLDADGLYVHTGSLGRAGFAVGAGLAVPIDHDRKIWIGPFLRYSQILDSEKVAFDTRDSKILSLGVSLEIGTGLARPRVRAPEPVACPVCAVAEVVAPYPDRDGDGLSDSVDVCPDVAGLVADGGCPPYQRVVVKPGKLELKEKIAFEWDSAHLETDSQVTLDEVVRVLQDNRSFKVAVEGHASSEGGEPHNQTLSEQRAAAVVDYLVSHGVAPDRLKSEGFGSTVPIVSNDTKAGRETNRRVEFVVAFIIVNDGSKP